MNVKPLNVMPYRWPVSAAGAVVISVILGVFFTDRTLPSLMASAVFAGIGAITSLFLVARHNARLTARMQDDAPIAWDVWMNGVKIGLITDAQYAAIERCAFGNGSVVIAQALNLARVALNLAGKIFVAVPLVMFWLLVVAAIAAPEYITEIVQAWQTAKLATLTASFGTLFKMTTVVLTVWVAVMFVLGHRFGFRNHFGEAIARMIRQHCNTPAEGDLQLSKIDMMASGVAHT